MKMNVSPIMRVSFGLIMLTLSMVFVADWLGLLPDQKSLELENRKKLGESLAIQFTSLVYAGDSKHVRTTLEALVERNKDIESAAFRSLVGEGTIEVGNHSDPWNLKRDAKKSTADQIVVPIYKGDSRWGSLEIRFAEEGSKWYSAISNNTVIMLSLFMACSGFLLYMVFLRRVLRELDPSKVVPDRVKNAFDTLAEGVLILDEEGQIVLANNSFQNHASLGDSKIIGSNARDLNWSAYQTAVGVREDRLPWSRVARTGKGLIGEKLTIHKDSNLERSYTVNCTPIHDDKDNIRGVITTFDDLTELERNNETLKKTLTDLKQTKFDVDLKNKELQYLASRDSLTNCLNRRAFGEKSALLYERAKEYQSDLVCIMVDIDHFKRINDNYGHAVGDKVIKFVADVLKKQIRREDLVGRYGGEEFCLILDSTTIDDAIVVAERMRKEITKGDPALFTSALRITASFGLATIEDATGDKDELVNKADKALYIAKESGRNKVMVWEKAPDHGVVTLDLGDKAQGDTTDKVGNESSASAPMDNVEEGDRILLLQKIADERAQLLDEYISHDPLTHLPERNLFIDRVEQALLRARREGRMLAVISIGLQNLHRISDTLGYESAQQLLQEAASRLRHVLRDTDAVALLSPVDSEATISKLNDGEFGILLPAIDDSESIAWIVKRILDSLQEPLFINDHNITILSNVGVGVYPSDGQEGVTLIRHASISRYYAEQQPGINNVEYFSEDINRVAKEQLLLESEMSDAIENEEFEVLYQPTIDMRTGEIIGFESLLRWNHPTRGLLTPNEFIDIAERTRLINYIGDWVLRQSCRQIAEFSEACSRELRCAVNMSPVQFSQPDLVERITGIVKDTDLAPEFLELELTEYCLMDKMDQAFEILSMLQFHGISISIDDFGTGYSGLSYLRTLPINILKVDRCFVADIDSSEHDASIVAAIVGMAKALELSVTAEGVETSTQLDILGGLGCDHAQGYLFSRPLSADKALELLLSKREMAESA